MSLLNLSWVSCDGRQVGSAYFNQGLTPENYRREDVKKLMSKSVSWQDCRLSWFHRLNNRLLHYSCSGSANDLARLERSLEPLLGQQSF